MSLTVVVPCFDEETRIGATLQVLCETLGQDLTLQWEVLVVDDQSTDATAAVVRQAAANEPRVRLLATNGRKGKGAAVREGALAAIGDAVLVTDADLAGDLAALPAMMRALDDADAVLGSRLLPGAVTEPARPLPRRCAAFVFRAAVRLVTPLRVSDPQCGCKLFRRQMLQHHIELLRTDGYAYEVELLIRLQAAGATLVELPIRWREGRGSKVRVIRDGVHMLRDLMRAVRMAKA
jgi:dolichyl-phosphate beta-glucosyltransferase